MFAITGITGQVGGAAARALLAAGQRVRAVVRNPAKAANWAAQGVEIAVAELHDAAALHAAFTSVEGVFVLSPPLTDVADPLAENRRIVAALTTALGSAQVPKVVYLSSIGAQQAHGTGAIGKLYDMEQAFRQLPLATAAIRAAWFMENFRGLVAPARESGQVFSFLAPLDRPVAMVAAEDIGQLVARTLQEPWTGPRVLELSGPRAYTPNDVTAALSLVLGRPLTTHLLPAADYEAVYASWGLTPAAATLMAEMIAGFNAGRIAFGEPGAEHHTGRVPLEDMLRQFATATPQ